MAVQGTAVFGTLRPFPFSAPEFAAWLEESDE